MHTSFEFPCNFVYYYKCHSTDASDTDVSPATIHFWRLIDEYK
jgi:hypothetical protein